MHTRTTMYPARGSEQAGRRPGLIVSNDLGNRFASTVIVAALTSARSGQSYSFQVRVPVAADTGLSRESMVLCQQLMTVAQERLLDRIGELPPDLMRRVDNALRVSLGLT